MISRKTAPYTGTLGSTETKHRSTAPSIEALKRGLARLGYMEWKGSDFTERWPDGGEFDKAFRQWQQAEEMPADGVYGEQAWKQLRAAKVPAGRPNAGKNALDAYACKLIRADWAELNVPDEADFRLALQQYCTRAEANEDNWHYVQYRPVDVTVEPNARYVRADCSSFVIMAYKWASTKSGLPGARSFEAGLDGLRQHGHVRGRSPARRRAVQAWGSGPLPRPRLALPQGRHELDRRLHKPRTGGRPHAHLAALPE